MAVNGLIDQGEILFLSGKDVRDAGVFAFDRAVSAVESSYLLKYAGESAIPKTEYLKYVGRSSYDRIICLLGWLGGSVGLSAVKTIGGSIGNAERGMPRASGLLTLHDPVTQRPVAILEGAQISAVRTAAVSAVALKYLASDLLTSVGLLGTGYLARVHLRMLSELWGERISEIVVYDINPSVLEQFCRMAVETGLPVRKAKNAEEVAKSSDILIPLTTEEKPYISSSWLRSTMLYCAVSLLDPHLDVIEGADLIVVDDLASCLNEGRPLQRMEQRGSLERKRIVEIGELVASGRMPKRENLGRIFFNPMGLVTTDIAVAQLIFREALNRGLGQKLKLHDIEENER